MHLLAGKSHVLAPAKQCPSLSASPLWSPSSLSLSSYLTLTVRVLLSAPLRKVGHFHKWQSKKGLGGDSLFETLCLVRILSSGFME